MDGLYWLIPAVTTFLSAASAVHILLNMKDDTDRAVSWLVVVFVFPLAGVICYLCWGISRRNTFGVRVARTVSAASGPDSELRVIAGRRRAVSPFIAREYEKSEFQRISFRVMYDRMFPENPPLAGNAVTLLCDGTDAYPEMLSAIAHAEKSIDMQSFIFANDRIGTRIFKALLVRARKGVRVRVIYDNFGSFGAMATRFFGRYENLTPNLEIHAFSRASLLQPWNFQLRNHRKLLVIDGKTAFTGGLNISADNFSFRPGKKPAIHDLHARIEGPAVGELLLAFLIDWCVASRENPAKVFQTEEFPTPEKAGDSVVRVISSGHGYHYEGTSRSFHIAAATARDSLWIQTPYFVPDSPFVQALKLAALRGVDVRVVVPAANNHFFMGLASKSLYETLLADGVRIFERRGNFSHAKALLADGEWAYFGSSNCDVRSFRLNYEIDLAVSGGDFVPALYEQFAAAFAESDEITPDAVAAVPVSLRLLRSACALFTPIL